MEFPSGLLYTKDHEWAQAGGDDTVTVGITDHAQEALGEVVYVELPKVGRALKEHETFGVVESIKAVSDLYAPVAGTVVAVNDAVAGDPSLVNRSAYKDGWIMRIKLADKKALESLMDAGKYKAYVETLK
ncbi:MAG: glycine cleavage system protein GcvH [Deltaproteobacteria bacterium]|nr:glycine cleavage system protein GcvH [Deltaproteobacteria bacterium]